MTFEDYATVCYITSLYAELLTHDHDSEMSVKKYFFIFLTGIGISGITGVILEPKV